MVSDAFNEELIYQTLKDILGGKKVTIPSYDYRTNSKYAIPFISIQDNVRYMLHQTYMMALIIY